MQQLLACRQLVVIGPSSPNHKLLFFLGSLEGKDAFSPIISHLMAVRFAAERGPVDGIEAPADKPPFAGRPAMLAEADGINVDSEATGDVTDPVVRSASRASERIRACGNAC